MAKKDPWSKILSEPEAMARVHQVARTDGSAVVRDADGQRVLIFTRSGLQKLARKYPHLNIRMRY